MQLVPTKGDESWPLQGTCPACRKIAKYRVKYEPKVPFIENVLSRKEPKITQKVPKKNHLKHSAK